VLFDERRDGSPELAVALAEAFHHGDVSLFGQDPVDRRFSVASNADRTVTADPLRCGPQRRAQETS
jgi:hypothetical protein